MAQYHNIPKNNKKMTSSITQYGAICQHPNEISQTWPHGLLMSLLVIRTMTFSFEENAPQQLMRINNYAQSTVTTLWIFLILLSLLALIETTPIITRFLSLLSLVILLAIWNLVYQRRRN